MASSCHSSSILLNITELSTSDLQSITGPILVAVEYYRTRASDLNPSISRCSFSDFNQGEEYIQ